MNKPFLTLLLFLWLCVPVLAFADSQSGQPGDTHEQTAPSTQRIDADELEAFLEPLFARHFSEHRIPGATFAAVQGTELVLARGFGVANIDTGEPVLPAQHLFNTGSITKLMTATAVMQQVERGKLDLDQDVDDYLVDFKVREAGKHFKNPIITPRDLLTHMAGFDESGAGMLAMTPESMKPLSQVLSNNLPRRVRQAGAEYQYSNHGMSLAGHLVEVTSGQSFPDYVSRHIFEPLGMDRSVIGRRSDLEEDIATGYAVTGESYRPIPPVNLALTPAGGLNATATDMARFMIAQLRGGRLGESRILSEASTRELQRTQFRPHPKISGTALGFYERLENGLRILEHAGDAPEGFSTLLVLIPEKDFGFFVSYNSAGGAFARFKLVGAILDELFPAEPAPTIEPPSDFAERQQEYAGTYRINRHISSGFMKPIGKLVSMYFEIRPNGDGTLTLYYPANLVAPSRLVEVEKDLFRHVDADIYVSFDRFGERIGRLNVGTPLVFTAEPIAAYDSARVYLLLFAFFQALFLAGTVLYPAGSVLRRLSKKPSTSSPVKRRQKWLLVGVSGLYWLFLLGFGLVTAFQVFGIPIWAYAVFTIPFAAMALTVPFLAQIPAVLKSGEWSLAGRIFYVGTGLAALVFPAVLYWWDMLGYQF
jgi:CubicO group peptidase (beta-lactamase class C family)